MKIKEIIKKIEIKFPLDLAYNWDNVGFLLGNKENNINEILLTLDVTNNVIEEAINNNIKFIISHHPFIFDKLDRINTSTHKGKQIIKLLKNDISIYCMHTNFDIAFDGLNDGFVKLLDVYDIKVFDIINKKENYMNGEYYGLGRTAILKESLTFKQFSEHLMSVLKMQTIRVVGDLESRIKKIAIVTGSGAEYFELAKENDIDVLITGDVKYHQAMDAIDLNVNIIDCGHFETENIFKDLMAVELKKMFSNDISIKKSCLNENPFTFIKL